MNSSRTLIEFKKRIREEELRAGEKNFHGRRFVNWMVQGGCKRRHKSGLYGGYIKRARLQGGVKPEVQERNNWSTLFKEYVNTSISLEVSLQNKSSFKTLCTQSEFTFKKTAGDSGSIVFFHPLKQYVFKIMETGDKYKNKLTEEYNKMLLLFNEKIPVPQPLCLFEATIADWTSIKNKIDSHHKNYENKVLVMKNEGSPLNFLSRTDENLCTERINTIHTNLCNAIQNLFNGGYKQTDWSNTGNFVIDNDNRVTLVDIESIEKCNKLDTITSVMDTALNTLNPLFERYCEWFGFESIESSDGDNDDDNSEKDNNNDGASKASYLKEGSIDWYKLKAQNKVPGTLISLSTYFTTQ